MQRLAMLVAMVLGTQGAQAQEKPKGAPVTKKPAEAKGEDGLSKPDYLSELARQLLRRRMERHGRDMTTLMTGVVLLKREVVQSLASNLAAEPRIAEIDINPLILSGAKPVAVDALIVLKAPG
jgi:hypothetical protein